MIAADPFMSHYHPKKQGRWQVGSGNSYLRQGVRRNQSQRLNVILVDFLNRPSVWLRKVGDVSQSSVLDGSTFYCAFRRFGSLTIVYAKITQMNGKVLHAQACCFYRSERASEESSLQHGFVDSDHLFALSVPGSLDGRPAPDGVHSHKFAPGSPTSPSSILRKFQRKKCCHGRPGSRAGLTPAPALIMRCPNI